MPVPDSGIPREWVDAAREAIRDNAKPSANAHRVWELSGGVLVCGECGCRMATHTTTDKKRGYAHHYYRCAKRSRHGALKTCAHGKFHKAEATEAAVWGLVSSLLKDPQRLRAGLEELIEQERAGLRGDPDRQAKLWLEKLSELEQERRGHLRLAAKGHMTDDDLGEALSELEDARLTAQAELEALQGRKAALEALEQDRDTLLESYAAMMPDALESLAPEERYQVYGMLRLKVEVSEDGTMQAQGVLSESLHLPDGEGEHLCENELAPRCNT